MFNLSPKEMKEIEDMLDNMTMDYDGYPTMDFWDHEYDPVPPVMSCKHEWVSEYYFSKNVYTTCKKCGKKKEEV